MGPGPANAYPRILAAQALPLLGHMHPPFLKIMDEISEGLRYALQTDSKYTLMVSGTGHAGGGVLGWAGGRGVAWQVVARTAARVLAAARAVFVRPSSRPSRGCCTQHLAPQLAQEPGGHAPAASVCVTLQSAAAAAILVACRHGGSHRQPAGARGEDPCWQCWHLGRARGRPVGPLWRWVCEEFGRDSSGGPARRAASEPSVVLARQSGC
jgi:hypothetical protein